MLPGRHDLARFSQGTADSSIRVCEKDGVVALIACDLLLRLGRPKLCLRGVGGGLDLVICRRGDSTRCDKRAVAGFVGRRLVGASLRSLNVLLLGSDGVRVISDIDTHQGFTDMYGLAYIDKSPCDLSRHAKAEVTLYAGSD